MKALLTLAAITAFVGVLAWTTLREQEVRCEVCVAMDGRRHCSVASGADAAKAREGAFNTACGTLSNSVSEDLACRRLQPVSVSCTP